MRGHAIFLGLALLLPACGGGGSGGSDPAPTPASYTDPGIETLPPPDENGPPGPSGAAPHPRRPPDSRGRGHGEGSPPPEPPGGERPEDTDPPTSGARHPVRESARGGFYRTPIAPDLLVGSMERGGVVITYDPSQLTPEDLGVLASLAEQHPGNSDPVVVVPRTDGAAPIILTAWTHRLRLGTFDRSRIEGFIALFLGQGPPGS